MFLVLVFGFKVLSIHWHQLPFPGTQFLKCVLKIIIFAFYFSSILPSTPTLAPRDTWFHIPAGRAAAHREYWSTWHYGHWQIWTFSCLEELNRKTDIPLCRIISTEDIQAHFLSFTPSCVFLLLANLSYYNTIHHMPESISG